jgi:predicted dithiol-disulfide oxidoreductase (DUF899 family)
LPTTTTRNHSSKDQAEIRNKMNTPQIVSQQEWEAARQQLLVKEKAMTRSRDALAAERRRMPWLAVDKNYEFDGPKGKVTLWDCFRVAPTRRSTAKPPQRFRYESRRGI